MTGQRAALLVRAEPAAVRAVLLRPLEIPDWNPAFLTLAGPDAAAVGTGYPITVRGGLRGTFAYTGIGASTIGWSWHVPGLDETGHWRLTPRDGGTLVEHEFTHRGPLARVLRAAFEGVAELRLGRLSDRVGS